MRKNNLSVFFGIFLVSMLFVPPSMPTTEAASEIPAWIKNNAGWWADGQIDDASFLKGIEYLMENFIILIPSNQKITPGSGLLQVDKFAYELPKYLGTTEVNVNGKFENWSGRTVHIEIVRPDGKIDEISTISTGKFELLYTIKPDFPLGNYQLSANSVNGELGAVSFKLNAQSDQLEKSIPGWIRNNAGWWAEGQIDDDSFVSGLQFLIKDGIIKVQQKKVDKGASFAPGVDENIIAYQTKLPAVTVSKGVFSAIVVHATHNDYCSNEENKIAAAYGKMAEHGLKKNIRDDPVQVLAICMKLDVIEGSTYPLVLKELSANRSDIIIFIGDLEANFESYIIYEALGWWKCEADYTSKWAFKGCGTHIIVVCDECTRPDAPDLEDVTARGMETLVHEIGHHNLFEDGFGRNVYGGSLHNAQAEIDYCNEGGVLETQALTEVFSESLTTDLCKKLIESVPIMGKIYPVMNLNFIENNWKKLDRIAEEDKITNWVDCKISNYENGITGNCVTEISTTQDNSEDNIQSTQQDSAAPTVPYFGASVVLDKIYYSTDDDVNILIVAPDFNAKSNVIEYIGTDTDSRVTIITDKGKLDFYKLVETGADTGIFSGSVSMKEGYYASTSGTGPWSGKIKIGNQDTITIQFSNTYSGSVDTVSAQGIVEGVLETTTSSDYSIKKYTDDDNRFSIEYPSGWIKESLPQDWLIIEFLDKYSWDAFFRVEFYEDISYVGTSDSNILEEILESERELCNGSTYQDDEFVCYNYKVNDSSVVYTNENRKAYLIDQQYTKQYDHPDYPGEYSMRSIVLETHVGNDVWMVTSEIDVRYLDKHLDKVISSSYSFDLSPGSTSASFKKYTDDYNRFTIEYPDDWVLADSHPNEIIAIQDQYKWRTNFQVFWNDDDTLDNRSDSKVLRAIERNQSEDCDDQKEGVRTCSDFKIVDSYITYTDDNKKVYFVKQAYTMAWKNISGKITGKEYPIVQLIGLIYDGNGSWFMQTESHEEVFDDHSDKIIHMMKSFSLK